MSSMVPMSYRLAGVIQHRAICSGCGEITDLPGEDVAGLIGLADARAGFSPEGVSVTVRGRCTDCRR